MHLGYLTEPSITACNKSMARHTKLTQAPKGRIHTVQLWINLLIQNFHIFGLESGKLT